MKSSSSQAICISLNEGSFLSPLIFQICIVSIKFHHIASAILNQFGREFNISLLKCSPVFSLLITKSGLSWTLLKSINHVI